MSEIIVEINDDGTVKIDASKMAGKEADILKELTELARSVGGDLEVEKHVGKSHTHTHEKAHVRS